MKKVFLALILLVVFAVGGAVVAFNAGLFHSTIQAKVQEALGAKTQLGTMALAYRWPLKFHVGQSTIQHPMAGVSWKSAEIEIGQLTAPYGLVVLVDQLNVDMKPLPDPKQDAPATGPTASSGGKLTPLKIAVELKNAAVKTPWATLRDLQLRFEQKLLMKTPASVHMRALVQAPVVPVALPLRLDTDSLTFSEDAVKASEFKAALGGLEANVQGTSLLKESRHRWLLDISAKDLSQLPPPADYGAKNWKGAIQLHAEVSKDGDKKPWSAEGKILAENVSANVQIKQSGLSVSGVFVMNADGKFSYFNEIASLPGLKASLDVSAAQVIYGDILSKAPGVPMKAAIVAASEAEKVNVQSLDLQLWNFIAQVKGSVLAKAPFAGDVQFNLKPVNLQGAEKLLMPLSKSPVQGEVSVAGKFSGRLTDPMKGRVIIDNLQMKKFMGVVDFEKPGVLSIKGPVNADLQVQGEWMDEKVKSAQGRGQIDLSQPGLVAGPLRKEPKALMSARFSVRNQGASILIDELELATFVGNLGVKGKAAMNDVPSVEMNVEAKPLNLSELRMAVPAYRDLIPKGKVEGKILIAGKAEFSKPWHDLPLNVSGQVKVNMPEYKMVPAMPEEKSVGKGGAPAKPVSTAFLPDGQLTRTLKLKLLVDVDKFIKDTLEAKSIRVDGQVATGKFSGAVEVKDVFGGAVSVKNLSVPLLQNKPAMQGTATWLNLTIQDALGFAKPDFRKFAEGKTSGVAEFSTVLPAEEDFMAQLRVRGDAVADPVTLNSVKIGQLINDALGKIPMIKLKPVKVEPLKGQIKSQFDLKQSVVDLNSFTAVDLDNSEIQMKGKVNISSMQGDLAGTFFWAQPQFSGCLLEGNADNRGRMVIPLAVKGDLMSPSFSMLSDLVSKLGGKALQCEQKKLVEKVKTQGTEQLQKELKKTLKNIFGN